MTIISHSFPRNARIRKRADYLACYATSKRWHSSHFILLTHYIPEQAARYGMSVSKKVGNAVARNRVKRLLREFFRLFGGQLTGWQIVAIAKPGASGLSFAEICAELGPKIKVLENNSF